jgi:hypothetical protein
VFSPTDHSTGRNAPVKPTWPFGCPRGVRSVSFPRSSPGGASMAREVGNEFPDLDSRLEAAELGVSSRFLPLATGRELGTGTSPPPVCLHSPLSPPHRVAASKIWSPPPRSGRLIFPSIKTTGWRSPLSSSYDAEPRFASSCFSPHILLRRAGGSYFSRSCRVPSGRPVVVEAWPWALGVHSHLSSSDSSGAVLF